MAAVFPTELSGLGHIFRHDEGHVPDTPANRELLLAVANDESARCAQDAYGSEWFARTQETAHRFGSECGEALSSTEAST